MHDEIFPFTGVPNIYFSKNLHHLTINWLHLIVFRLQEANFYNFHHCNYDFHIFCQLFSKIFKKI